MPVPKALYEQVQLTEQQRYNLLDQKYVQTFQIILENLYTVNLNNKWIVNPLFTARKMGQTQTL